MWWLLGLAGALAGTREPRGDDHAAVKAAYQAPRVVVGAGVADPWAAYPALRVGGEFPLVVGVTNRRSRKGRLRNGVGELFVAAHVTGWVEPRSAVPVGLSGEIGTRWTGHTGGHVGLHAGAGYLHTFNAGLTVRVADDGQVRRRPLGGNPGWLGQTALSFGYDVGKRHDVPLSLAVRQGLGMMAPVNGSMLGVLLTELTFTVRLEGRR